MVGIIFVSTTRFDVADARNVLIVYLTLCLKSPTNEQYAAYGSSAAFTQNFKLVNPFYNFFFHIGILKFLCTSCPSKDL